MVDLLGMGDMRLEEVQNVGGRIESVIVRNLEVEGVVEDVRELMVTQHRCPSLET